MPHKATTYFCVPLFLCLYFDWAVLFCKFFFTFDYTYNPVTGMPETYTYPSGFQMKYGYNQRGDLNKVFGFFDGNWIGIWTGNAQNQRGQLVDQDFGNGVKNEKYFDEYGYLQSDIVSNRDIFQHFDYKYNYVTGNLTERSDRRHRHTENFEYDDQLQKLLKSWTINDATSYSMDYANNGNILRKSDVSTEAESYQYQEPQGKPHAVSQIVNPTDDFLSKFTWQEIDYNSFNKIESITQPFYDPSVDRHRLRFTYGTDQSRRKMDYYFVGTDDTEIIRKSKYYLDNFESVVEGGVTKNYHYIHSPDGLFGIMVADEDKKEFYYIHTDHLGSITAVTNREGTLLQSLSYDPWGRRRNPNDWADYSVSASMFDRGFTGHEHLDEFGLINMNGRVYDPFLARFLSPDPFITEPHNAQNYNRYTYALNNPLRYTDPSGYYHEFWDDNDRVRLHIAGGGGAYGTVDWSHHMRTGGQGPGSGNHWSDQYRSVYGNFMLGSQSSFDRMYGTGAWDSYYTSAYTNQGSSGSGSIPGSTVITDRTNISTIIGWISSGFNVSIVSAFGNTNLIGSFGSLGSYSFGADGAIRFANPTAGMVAGEGMAAGQGGMPGWATVVNTGIGAFNSANGLKSALIEYAVRSNYKSARTWSEFNNLRSSQQAWRTTRTLGKTGASYLKYAKGLGYVGAGLTTAYSVTNAYNYFNNGGTDWSVYTKSGLDVIMTGVGFLGPIGFGISASYFILDATTGGFGGFGQIKP